MRRNFLQRIYLAVYTSSNYFSSSANRWSKYRTWTHAGSTALTFSCRDSRRYICFLDGGGGPNYFRRDLVARSRYFWPVGIWLCFWWINKQSLFSKPISLFICLKKHILQWCHGENTTTDFIWWAEREHSCACELRWYLRRSPFWTVELSVQSTLVKGKRFLYSEMNQLSESGNKPYSWADKKKKKDNWFYLFIYYYLYSF